ncbi:Aldehyde dehydrogenase domain [Dillenia turbinata]|uniref:Aldehyde dehydrogenase 1 n=1 Tax=Dillenia turbinata TaxID=194707 RepID=A0AAN8ZPS6_9MAGN
MATVENGNSAPLLKTPETFFTKLFINGEFVDSVSGKTMETIDPRTEEVTIRVAEGDKEDVDLAVKAARHAFDHGPWPRMSGAARGRIIIKFAELIEQHGDEIATLDGLDNGKLFTFGKYLEIPSITTLFRYFAGAADKIHGTTAKMASHFQAYTLKEPIGVVGHIMPWNFPSSTFAMKVAPSLAAGCTMVIKPAEQTPLSALYFAHLSKLAGFPDGVINVVNGYGHTAGAAITSHMDIDKVSFTGSTEVGVKVMQAAATSNLKVVSLELGGKSPILIFDDADVDKAVEIAFTGGEMCVACSRVFVQEGIYDKFVEKIAGMTKIWTVGDPFDPTSRNGPQAHKEQFEKVLSYIEHGKREGATLLTGGNRVGDKGYYIEPTIFTDVKDDMKIAKDEIFGPVMSILKFKTCAGKEREREREREMASHTNGDSESEALSKIPKIKFTKLFINGEFVDSISGKTLETIDPRTGEAIASVAEGDKEDVDLAVKAARHAFDHGPWPRMSGAERRQIIMKFADLVEQNAEELAALDSIDHGKLFVIGKFVEIPITVSCLRYYAGAADKIHGSTLKMGSPFQAYTLCEPIGVVGHIMPWNFPSGMWGFKVAPALAAGCTTVIKPAEQAPLSALYFAHLSKLAGVPDGVINVVNGYGPTAGAAISSHMDIDMVSFTGSTEVGTLVMQAAATSNLKVVSLELGGKSPLIIFDDADVDKAAEYAFLGAHKEQYDKVLSFIEHGKREGATLLTGGKPCGDKGYYIEPTIFTDVKDDMLIVKEEIFGPVMSVIKFKTIEEAIERANNTKYGLAAGIMTKNLDIANRVSRSIRAGIIWINCYLTVDADCPYGGYKMSGFGRDLGLEGLAKYLHTKSVVTPLYNSPWL